LEPRTDTDIVNEPDERVGNVHLLGFLTRGSRECALERELPERRNIDVQRVGVRGFLGKLEDPTMLPRSMDSSRKRVVSSIARPRRPVGFT